MVTARYSNQKGSKRDKTHARSNQPRTSQTYRRQGDILWVRTTVSTLVSGVLPIPTVSAWWAAQPTESSKVIQKNLSKALLLLLVSEGYTKYVCMYVQYGHHHIQQSMDQPGKVASAARGQLNRENNYFPVPVRSSKFGLARRVSAVPSRVSLLILHTQAESGADSRDSSRFPLTGTGLATAYGDFFGLATNMLNVRNRSMEA